MAVELTRVALWVETVEPGKPLGFLDANICVGDSLLGIFDLDALRKGIPDAAYKPLTGDDKATAHDFDLRNKRDKGEETGVLDFSGQRARPFELPPLAASLRTVRELPEDTVQQIEDKREHFRSAHSDPRLVNLSQAADLYIAAFLTSKNELQSLDLKTSLVPTTSDVWAAIRGSTVYGPRLGASRQLTSKACAFHWPLEFPDIMADGGFDVVLGNPPWERIKIQEQEFFASREPAIAEAPNAAARSRLIKQLEGAPEGTRERAIYREFEITKRIAKASAEFARLKRKDGGRFPLTGQGDVNTYALFAELFHRLVNGSGRAGIIVPTGIAFDKTTRHFFDHLMTTESLVSLLSFFEVRKWFKATDDRKPFCLLTIGKNTVTPTFSFDVREISELLLAERQFQLTKSDIKLLNPNTFTAPVCRSRADAELTIRIYSRIPVLINESRKPYQNPWDLTFLAMFHMANDSGLFSTTKELQENDQEFSRGAWSNSAPLNSDTRVPLYEAKMLHHFDHRWNTFESGKERQANLIEKTNPSFEPMPRYWVPQGEVQSRIEGKQWSRLWLLGWRDIVGSEGRTLIPCLCPAVGVGDKFLLALSPTSAELNAALYACLGSLICDYLAKQKVGGSSLKYFVFKQLPILPPAFYAKADLFFVVERVLELTYTSHSMTSFARDLGYNGEPFPWDEDRRALLRAELDAWYARAYGLTRDELRYILDPTDVKGKNYPSETFRVLKNNETKLYHEYRTRRLVLDAWDRMERGELPAPEPYDRRRSAHALSTTQVAPAVSAATGQGLLQFTPERPR
jgi:hypothetical protein